MAAVGLDALWLEEAAALAAAPPPSPADDAGEATATAKSSALALRRQRNRECMRRARQRQRDELARMRAVVARLEDQLGALCVRAAPAIDDTHTDSGSDASRQTDVTSRRRYAAARALAQRLGAENLFLKAGLQQHAAWTQALERITESLAAEVMHGGVDADLRALGASGASPGGVSAAMALNLNVLDALEAETHFSFSPLDEAAVSRAIVDNAHETQQIRAALLAAADAEEAGTSRRDVLGWDVVQRVHGTWMEYMFTKTFTDLDVHAAGHKMWTNDMQVDNFRRVKRDLRRLEVLQVASANAYVLGRDVNAPDRSTVFRSLFMRFRTQVRREIPNGDAPPLQAAGFVIGTHSLNRDWASSSSSPRYPSYLSGSGAPPAGIHDGESLEWADLTLTTEFLTIEDPTTGETHHQIQWVGRTDYKSPVDAVRNAPDTLTVCLRTEMLLFRPVVRVIDSDAAD